MWSKIFLTSKNNEVEKSTMQNKKDKNYIFILLYACKSISCTPFSEKFLHNCILKTLSQNCLKKYRMIKCKQFFLMNTKISQDSENFPQRKCFLITENSRIFELYITDLNDEILEQHAKYFWAIYNFLCLRREKYDAFILKISKNSIFLHC